MNKMMNAAIAYEFGKPLVVESIPVPDVPSGMILVKLVACGVCHSDLHAVNGDWPIKPKLPLIPGHEGVGIVESVGEGVIGIKEGDRVGVPWLYKACGKCEYCLSGWETLCEQQLNTGYSVDGCYAQYIIADPNYVAHLPANLGFFEAASILCAGLTVYKGIKETEVKSGDWIVISGVGGLGHLAIQYAKAMGIRVIALDIHEEQLELAKSLKADIVINVAKEDPIKKIKTAISGAHGVLVTAVSPNSFSQGVDMLRRKGVMVLVGLPSGKFELSIFDTVLNRKTVRGSIVGTRMDLIESLDFAARGLVTVHYTKDKLENINNIFSAMKSNKITGRIIIAL